MFGADELLREFVRAVHADPAKRDDAMAALRGGLETETAAAIDRMRMRGLIQSVVAEDLRSIAMNPSLPESFDSEWRPGDSFAAADAWDERGGVRLMVEASQLSSDLVEQIESLGAVVENQLFDQRILIVVAPPGRIDDLAQLRGVRRIGGLIDAHSAD